MGESGFTQRRTSIARISRSQPVRTGSRSHRRRDATRRCPSDFSLHRAAVRRRGMAALGCPGIGAGGSLAVDCGGRSASGARTRATVSRLWRHEYQYRSRHSASPTNFDSTRSPFERANLARMRSPHHCRSRSLSLRCASPRWQHFPG